MFPTTKSIESVAPVAIIGATLLFLLWHPVPGENRDFVNVILAGLLGYLSKSRNEPQSTTVTTGSPPDETTVKTGAGA